MNIIKEQPITAEMLDNSNITRYEKCYVKGDRNKGLICEFQSCVSGWERQVRNKIFNNIEINHADIFSIELCDTKLFGGNISNTYFNYGNIEKIVITRITFTHVDFHNIEFKEIEFRECHFSNCLFEDCKLEKTKFNDCQFEKVSFNLKDEGGIYGDEYNKKCKFILCKFNLCKFNKFELSHGKFFKCKFIETDIFDTIFRNILFNEVDFIKTDQECKLGGIVDTGFIDCEIKYSEFNEFHYIIGCNIEDTIMDHVNFGGSIIKNLNFINVSVGNTFYKNKLLNIPKNKEKPFNIYYDNN